MTSTTPAAIVFFHQNDVYSRQGGIERYLATLLACAAGDSALVAPAQTRRDLPHCAVACDWPPRAPQWVKYLFGLVRSRHEIRRFLKERNARVLEFSRPEYLLISGLFPGKRVVTIHGTGPQAGERLHWLLHHFCCLLLPALADRVQIVGRDPSGVPTLARRMLGDRLVFIDAWHDDRFVPSLLPPLDGAPLKVFYAGRIAPQKNPELLFSIIREAERRAPGAFSFHYFGSDYADVAAAGLGGLVTNHGFLGPEELSKAIASCHVGLLCSAYGEGSPFVIVEALACGRPYVLPPLPTLLEAYRDHEGVAFVEHYRASEFVDALLTLRDQMVAGALDPFHLAAQISHRAQSRAAPHLLETLSGLGDEEPPPC